jgi:hypothetical protein
VHLEENRRPRGVCSAWLPELAKAGSRFEALLFSVRDNV